MNENRFEEFSSRTVFFFKGIVGIVMFCLILFFLLFISRLYCKEIIYDHYVAIYYGAFELFFNPIVKLIDGFYADSKQFIINAFTIYVIVFFILAIILRSVNYFKVSEKSKSIDTFINYICTFFMTAFVTCVMYFFYHKPADFLFFVIPIVSWGINIFYFKLMGISRMDFKLRVIALIFGFVFSYFTGVFVYTIIDASLINFIFTAIFVLIVWGIYSCFTERFWNGYNFIQFCKSNKCN